MFKRALENIKGTIEIREQERSTFRLLFLHSFLIGLASSLYFVEASRNFITKISIAEMPVAYVLSGVVGYMLMQVFKSLQKRVGVVKSFGQMLLIFSFFMILLYAGRVLLDKDIFYIKLFAYAGFVLMFAFATVFAVGFAGVCLSIFNLSQSKRLLALLGTGEILASILGYLVVPVLVNVMGNSIYLLLLAAFFSLLSVWPIRLTEHGMKEPKKVTVTAAAPVQKFNFAFIWKNPFILYLSLTTLFSIITVYFIDYSYLISVRYFSQLTGVEIATTVAMVFTVIKTGELFASVFSSSIVASLGMRTSVLLLPLLLIFGGAMAVFSVVFFNASPVFMIFFLFINKWIDRVVRKGITIPSTKIMFQINSPEERVQLQNNIDGVISQVSTIICGLLLTALCFIVGTSDYEKFLSATTLVCLVVFLVFLFMSSRLFRIYKVRIQDFLRTKHVVSQVVKTIDKEVTIDTDAAITLQLERLINETDLSDKIKLRALICYYNPSADTYSHFAKDDSSGEAEFIRKITKLYFDNQNIFSRFLVIAYFLCLDPDRQLRFFKDIYHVSPLRLRTYFLKQLTRADFLINVSDEFYFSELTSQCINEILWTESAINDLEGEPVLTTQLKLHKEELTNALLYLLQFLNDKKSIQLIGGILKKTDRNEEDLLFACELLENTLRPSLKKLVLPVFEPVSFIKRRNKMSSFFYEPSLPVNERLRDIMMHNFNMLDSYTKQLALKALYTSDAQQLTVKAFSESRISNLKAIVTPSAEKMADNKEILQIDTINRLATLLRLDEIDVSDIIRWGIYDSQSSSAKTAKVKPVHEIENATARISVDAAMNSYFEIDLIGLTVLSSIARS